MKYELSSYFEEPEFKELLTKYEEMANNGLSSYFETDDLITIAEYYTAIERNQDAEKAIDLALHFHPQHTDALIFRSRLLAMKGNMDEAYAVADQIEDSSDREVKFLKADLLMDENRMEEADEIFMQLAQDENYELETLLDIFQEYIDVNQQLYAERWFMYLSKHFDITNLSKKEQNLRDTLCDYYITFNHAEQAIPLLRMNVDEHPYSIRHWNDLGKCFLQMGQHEDAHEAFDFALAIDDTEKETLILKAFSYEQSGNLKEAAKYYLRLAKVSENKIRPYLALANVYLEMREYDSAVKYIDILLKHKGLSNYQLAELYADAALCHAALGHSKKGQEYISKAIELNGNDPDILISAGKFFLKEAKHCKKSAAKNKNVQNALKQFDDAIHFTAEEDMRDTLLSIASACFDTQNFEYASNYFEQMNDDFPEQAKTTYFFLIYCYYYMQQLAPFMHYLGKIKEEIPEMYAELGEAGSLIPDKQFNELLREMKDNINSGKIDINKYL